MRKNNLTFNRKKKNPNSKIVSFLFGFIIVLTLSLCLIVTKSINIFTNINDKKEVQEGTELEDDNWELSVVFYDSTVNNGLTPLTEINWDNTNRNEERIIKIQVNYKNTNVQNNYRANDIKIKVDTFKGRNYGGTEGGYKYGLVAAEVSAGTLANGFDWRSVDPYSNHDNYYTFLNNVNIEKNANFEGSLQLTYTLRANTDYSSMFGSSASTIYASPFKTTEPETIRARLVYDDKEVESNTITLNYSAPRAEYTVSKTANKITGLDGLPNANDYVWVKWNYEAGRIDESGPRNAHHAYVIDYVPEGAVVCNKSGKQMEINNNSVRIDIMDWHLNRTVAATGTIYIGYPKDTYQYQNITNRIELYGTYEDEEEVSLLANYERTINLTNFEFTYTGELYKIYKMPKTVYSKPANAGSETFRAEIKPEIVYTGTKYDAIIGEDVMVFPTPEGTYRILDDSEYHIKKVESNPRFHNALGAQINGNKVEFYVRYANTTEYVKHSMEVNIENLSGVTFPEDNIVGLKIVVKDLECGVIYADVYIDIVLHTNNIASSGTGYNFAYLQIKQGNEIVNTPTIDSYSSAVYNHVSIADYDQEHYGMYMQRSSGQLTIKDDQATFEIIKSMGAYSQIDDLPAQQLFKIRSYLESKTSFNHSLSDHFYGLEIVDLLPEGLGIFSTEDEMYDSMLYYFRSKNNKKFKTVSGTEFADYNEFWDYFREHTSIDIIENYNNTNRTLLKVKMDYTDDPLIISPGESTYGCPTVYFDIYFSVPYDSYFEYGSEWTNKARGYLINYNDIDYTIDKRYYSYTFERWKDDTDDLNGNGITNEQYYEISSTARIVSAMESHQDIQTSVQTDKSNFATGKVKLSKDTEYTYKLRVRTGQSVVTNLVIYDSIEDYAKNPELETIKASNGKPSWQGEFTGVDTSFAESKGYTVKVYYNENPNPGNLTSDNTWQEYTDETDKSKVKTLAFKYLDAEGNSAVLPANTNSYVLIKMKSPNEDLKTFSYNGCWTEWNAIDASTGRPVDFITGINSNIVKLALPTSVEPTNRTITLKKVWDDKYNALELRPNSVTFKIIPNDDYANAVEVPLTGTYSTWTTQVSVPEHDDYGETINYTIAEDTIDLGNGYKYIPTVNNFTITNTISKELTLTKIWKDNNNAYLTRPANVSFQVKQNGNNYKSVTFGGSLTTNVWTETINVPIYSSNGNEYTYTIEEVSVDNYSSSCTEFTCTNTLTGDNTITIKKEWKDKDNSYNSRPDSISIRLKQNNEVYQSVNLTGTTNIWESDTITLPMYDNNGIKYNYTIEETQVTDYGEVTYDQANLKVTNTLKKNISITITKKWIDDSNALDLRPENLTITLQRNGTDYQNVTLTGTTDTWTTTIEVPKYDDNQDEYTYTIKELIDGVNEDYSNISYSQEELSVTNKLEKKTNITISKIWDDGDNELLTRPASIKLNLLRNGDFFEEIEIIPDDISDNTWSVEIEDLDVYDRNGAKYTYTIEENLEEQLERYETITYDQTNLTITNKLTIPPKVTLFFTVKNGYTLPGNDDLLYDQEGYNDVLSRYDLNGDDEYIFHFELENIETGEIIEGKLSTQGTLEFDDVPYGTYRAREGEDKYFSFVSMIEIEEVLGVTFTQDEMGGTITISPTGHDIVYGAQITNKIEIPVENPETNTLRNTIYIAIIILLLNAFIGLKLYNKYSFLK